MATNMDSQRSLITSIDKKIRKLDNTWAKFKKTPASIKLLVQDLSILNNFITTIPKSGNLPQQFLLAVSALPQCKNALQSLLDDSVKYTSRFSRKSLTPDNLMQLELGLSDLKIKFLMVQFLVQKKELSLSRSVFAEALAHLEMRKARNTGSGMLEFDSIEPKTDSLLSFKCYSDFVGREKTLLELDTEFESSDTVLLTGLSGIGKCQVALEYATRFRNRRHNTQVFWVDCESSSSFEGSYRNIAERLKLPGALDYRADILDKTRRHLNQSRRGKYLIILQNVSESSLRWNVSQGLTTVCPNQYQMKWTAFLPDSTRCPILAISSDSSIEQNFPGTVSVINLPILCDVEASTLFQSRIPISSVASPEYGQLVKAVDSHPLAICQAAAFMVATRCDASRYLQILKNISATQYQKTQDPLNMASNTSESCFKTTFTTFTLLLQQNPRAAELLCLMAACQRRGLAKNILWHAWEHGISKLTNIANLADLEMTGGILSQDKVLDSDRAEYFTFTTALATLEAYLMVKNDDIDEVYSMHTVVQSTILSVLQQQGTLCKWRSAAIILLSATSHIFRNPLKYKANVLSTLLLHIAEVAQHPHTTTNAGLAKAKILCDIAAFKIFLMQPKASTPLLQEAFIIQKELLKPQDWRTLRTLLSLAESTSYSESPTSAIPLYIEAIAGCKQTLGPGNRRTLFAQLSLCANYITTGEMAAAAVVHFEAQAAASASLQITSDDKRSIEQRLGDLGNKLAFVKHRQGKGLKTRPRSLYCEDFQQRGRLKTLRQERKRLSMRSFSANSRVSSLDSIVEMFEVETRRI